MNHILMAPTTLPDTPPLEYIAAATMAGYDGLALRVHASPGLPFHPILGDAALIRDIGRALSDAPPVREIGSFYLQPDTAVPAFEPTLALGAEFGAQLRVRDRGRSRLEPSVRYIRCVLRSCGTLRSFRVRRIRSATPAWHA